MCSFFLSRFPRTVAQGDRLGTSPYSSPGAWEREGGGGVRGFGWEQRGGGSVVANRVEMGDYRKLTVN